MLEPKKKHDFLVRLRKNHVFSPYHPYFLYFLKIRKKININLDDFQQLVLSNLVPATPENNKKNSSELR